MIASFRKLNYINYYSNRKLLSICGYCKNSIFYYIMNTVNSEHSPYFRKLCVSFSLIKTHPQIMPHHLIVVTATKQQNVTVFKWRGGTVPTGNEFKIDGQLSGINHKP